MPQKTVTVFGGSGFLGRYVVGALAKEGWTIKVAVRFPSRARFLQPLGGVGQITPVHCNLRNREQIEAVIAGSQAVVNLVGLLSEFGAQSFQAVQFEGAKALAEAAAKAGVSQFVQLSAIGADAQSASRYAQTKAAAEQAVLAAMPQAVILRPSVVFGPEDDFFNRFAVMARLAPALPLIGGGATKFQPVYVGDVALAVSAALKTSKAAGQTYELGGPKVYSFKEVLEYILEVTQRKRFLLPLPFGLAKAMGSIAKFLPNAPITDDQVILLQKDNVVSPKAKTLADLGVTATALELIVPQYLQRYRPGGRFSEQLG